jgi:CRP-like cAMP-binding protein
LKNDGRPGSRAVGENPVLNTILVTLPDNEFQALRSQLEWQSLPMNTVLVEPGSPMQWGYFLNDGLASAVVPTGDGRSVEVAGIDKNGFVGIPLLVGIQMSIMRTIIRVPGDGFRISREALERFLTSLPQLRSSLGKAAMLQGMQAAQTAACNRLHDLQQRLARWLLNTCDGVGPEFGITQEYLAEMLGTGRPSVSLVAGQMQKAGVIQYTRGAVKIVDRSALERLSCECYANVQRIRNAVAPA